MAPKKLTFLNSTIIMKKWTLPRCQFNSSQFSHSSIQQASVKILAKWLPILIAANQRVWYNWSDFYRTRSKGSLFGLVRVIWSRKTICRGNSMIKSTRRTSFFCKIWSRRRSSFCRHASISPANPMTWSNSWVAVHSKTRQFLTSFRDLEFKEEIRIESGLFYYCWLQKTNWNKKYKKGERAFTDLVKKVNTF